MKQSAWHDVEPIRAEMFGPERLEQHARSLADAQVVVDRPPKVVSIVDRLGQNAEALLSDYHILLDEVRQGRPITPAAEWLVDNFHAVERQVRDARRDLPPRYFRELPRIGGGFLAGHPRVFGMVWAYVAHTDSLLDPALLARYVRAYERRTALTLGELWAVPITLRLVLIENLRRLTDRIVWSGHERRRADGAADQLLRAANAGAAAAVDLVTELVPSQGVSRPFAVQLARRMRGHAEPEVSRRIVEHLVQSGLDSEAAVDEEQQLQAQATVTMRNIFTSLRLTLDINWQDWLEDVSLIEEELRTNPRYAALDFPTRNRYRTEIELLARRSRQEEIGVARAALQRARSKGDELKSDVGFWLIDEGRAVLSDDIGYRPRLREMLVRGWRRTGLVGYLGAVAIVLAALVALMLWSVSAISGPLPAADAITLGIIGALALSELSIAVVNHTVTRTMATELLPALSLSDGVPDHLRLLIAIPALLTDADEVDELVSNLEIHYLSNHAGEVYFALVTDLPSSTAEHAAGDDELINRAVRGIRDLNARHGPRFLLLHRHRIFDRTEREWMGWERKRGKLHELNEWLRGSTETTIAVIEGFLPGPVKYVLTLDSDTRLPRESARRLVGKLAHPLNQAHLHPSGRVSRGYGILQPRVSPSLPSIEDSSVLQRVYSTPRGLDPYSFAVSDVYQDFFGEGSFSGKGIYDVDIARSQLRGRIPDDTVLSHDLLEGNYMRSGLVTDVEVVEEYPCSYAVSAARQHRWTRGDWQLLPWLVTRCAGLSRLGRWKMLDNLRRSITPVALVAGLLVSIAVLPAAASVVWLGVIAAVLYVPPLMPLVDQLFHWRRGVTARSQIIGFLDDAARAVNLGTMNLVLLAHQAWLMGDAIVRTLTRLVTRRHLLEWTTAAQVAKSTRTNWRSYLGLMRGGLVAPAAAMTIAALRGGGHLALVAPIALVWLGAPFVARWASEPDDIVTVDLDAGERDALRRVARRTWRFFETFVTAEEHHLPPDNFQEEPAPVVAHRTSPTNIGLYILSTITATEMGWLTPAEAVDRLEKTMATVDSMEHYHGHLYNWYDTRTLAPLSPRYVSTVDNGNLAGHLLTAAVTCREWADRSWSGSPLVDGLRDTLGVLGEEVAAARQAGTLADADGRTATEAASRALNRLRGARPDDSTTPAVVDWIAEELKRVAAVVDAVPAAREVSSWVALARTLTEHIHRLRGSALIDGELVERLTALAAVMEREVVEMDFRMLYNHQRSLLSIGYHVDDEILDESCYDQLASEARLASFIAIVKGDVRTKHWFRLARTVTAVGSGAALISWSGSMFEYLMPSLVMRSPSGSLLQRTLQLVVRRQIEYAAGLNLPWGISESAFNARDTEMTYQYSPFGVPGLGAVRGLGDNLVVAPYATGLAAMVEPDAAVHNFARLAALGGCGRYGFYEALDFTPSRVPVGQDFAIVRCFMSHHQGMTIVAIHNAVNNGIVRDRFHAEPTVRAGELLLQERAPRDVPVTLERNELQEPVRGVRTVLRPIERRFDSRGVLSPSIHHLSNGSLTVAFTPATVGATRWRALAVTRWHADPTSDQGGERIYLRDRGSGEVWSATPVPCYRQRDRCVTSFAPDHARYIREHGGIETDLEYHVSPEIDAVVRRLSIRNHSRSDHELDVTTYAELVLGDAADDRAHPAFSKLFVHVEVLADGRAIVATRRRREDSAAKMWVGHLLTDEHPDDARSAPARIDRRRFLGRNGSPDLPLAMQHNSPERFAARSGYPLDPISSLGRTVRVPAGGAVRLYAWTFVGESREQVIDMIDRHEVGGSFERVVMLSWTQAQVRLRHLGVTPDEAALYQQLAGYVSFPDQRLRPSREVLATSAGPQSALWSLGVSGDLPIVVVPIDDADDVQLVREVVGAYEFWQHDRFAVDLVIVNERRSAYVEGLSQLLESVIGSIRQPPHSPSATGQVRLVRGDQVDPQALRALWSAARVLLPASRGSLQQQLDLLRDAEPPTPPTQVPALAVNDPLIGHDGGGLQFFNSYGGFSPQGHEYVITLDGARSTPAPWTNVIANPQFGFQATADGAGCTWWRNSRDNQLTPWRNDPVQTPLSEVFYVRDGDGVLSSPTPRPFPHGRHVVRHGFGYTVYDHTRPGLRQELIQFVPPADPVKLSRLRLTNTGERQMTVTVTWYAEPVLGFHREQTATHLISERDEATGALLVRNPWSLQYADQVVFADLGGRQQSWSGDRTELLGRHGTTENPAAATGDEPLSGRLGAGYDPAVALRTTIELDPGATDDIVVVFGAARTVDEARHLVEQYRQRPIDDVLGEMHAWWGTLLRRTSVSTPDPSFDLALNGWLMYQTISGRMLGRCGYYQTSGAYGFRDQLQDSMTLVLVDPQRARDHLLTAAGRQFPEGDVQHWWLPENGFGVRTRITDDVVWLAYVTAHYIRVTGDGAVLDEQVPFIEGQRLLDDEHEMAFSPTVSDRTATLFEHCVLGLDRVLKVGRRGLPLMGGGDWNDGMNRVGIEGRGESVWLGWFTVATLAEMIPIAEHRGATDLAKRWRKASAAMVRALERFGWDGDWYRRAFFDDGSALGTAGRSECEIDSIAQTWAVLAGAGERARGEHAVNAALERLVDDRAGIVKLLTPPFDVSEPDPGYIRAYPPGVRENGGQYTHAATWMVFALGALGRDNDIGRIFSMINPINHARTDLEAERFLVEPYVVSGDVYGEAPYTGRGGWSWYTGSSAWLYRAGLEAILGVRVHGEALTISPCLPADWPRAEVRGLLGDRPYVVEISGEPGAGRVVESIIVDGTKVAADEPIQLQGAVPDGGHIIQVQLGRPAS